MYVSCDNCGYDSGDEPDRDELLAKVRKDGGKAEATPRGMVITCPKCAAADDRVRVD